MRGGVGKFPRIFQEILVDRESDFQENSENFPG